MTPNLFFDFFIDYILVMLLMITGVITIISIVVIKNKLNKIKKVSEGQSLKSSTIESLTDAILGYFVSWLIMFIIIPVVYPNCVSTATQSLGAVFLFTISSFIRRFITRRIFNFLTMIGILK